MKITALVENTSKKGWPVEHGLSLYIETVDHRILFDTGQSRLFMENAERAGIKLEEADICILSHGHYDHGGGLKDFTTINRSALIYMNKNAFGLHYHGEDRYIGLNRKWLEDKEFMDRVRFTDSSFDIDDGLSICCPQNDKRIDMGSAGLTVKEKERFIPEDFRHEHYLLIREGGKRILISGCSHQGIINIMEWFKPDIMIGGFHFMHQKLDETLRGYARILAGYDTIYYTCHCTGAEQFEFLKTEIEKLYYLSEGETVIF